jgi:hypothetical protein
MIRIALILAALLAASPGDDAAYTADITKRANDIIALLNIPDAARTDRVREIIVAQYRGLRALHDARDAKIKELGGKEEIAKVKADTAAEVKKLHDDYLSKLAAIELTPEQIEKVKDKMVYNKVQVTYKAYEEIYGPLTEEQKAKARELLKQAREEAMDGGSSQEKDAIFKKYKGKINNYLSSQGIDMKKREKEWGQKQKAKSATTQAA